VAPTYTFGDDAVAVRRIGLVAELFAASSRALLARAAEGLDRCDAALDLGCGPGHTTRLLAEVTGAGRTLGLDASDRYPDAARAATTDPAVAYAVHDVTRLPLPGAPADVIYARLVLAHLPAPLDLARGWLTQIRSGGVLVLEEVEHIEAPPGALRAYEELVTALVADEGGTMAAGPLLAPLGGECVAAPVDRGVAARMFRLNLGVWGDDAVRRGLATPAEVADLAAGLDAVGRAAGGSPVGWTLRQVVCRAA
jgi:SAM-dependent methyltransferase